MSEYYQYNTLPFLKWVGGKRGMINEIRERLPHLFHDYYEPFVGGGSVFFGLQDKIRKAYLSDVNIGLINTYNSVKLYPEKFIEELRDYKNYHSKEFYYHVRDYLKCKGMVQKAAQFTYLNRAGFRGMYRVNKKGKFNVPFGYNSVKSILQKDRIMNASLALQKVTITRRSFDGITPKKGDFIFLDPPYHKEEKMFTEYTSNGFGLNDHERLLRFIQHLDRKGVQLMITHQDSPYIRERYKGFNIDRIPVKRRIANGYTKDNRAFDLIIRNYD